MEIFTLNNIVPKRYCESKTFRCCVKNKKKNKSKLLHIILYTDIREYTNNIRICVVIASPRNIFYSTKIVRIIITRPLCFFDVTLAVES